MSLRSLLTAVESQVRATLSDSPYDFHDSEIGLTPGGQPPPEFAWKYLSVHSIAWEPGNIAAHVGLHEQFTVGLTLSIKFGEVPFSDIAKYQFYLVGEGMESTLRACIAVIHQNYVIVEAANTLITDPTADKHQKFLEWIGSDPEPIQRGPEWVFSDNEDEILGAYTQTARFRGGDRLQRRELLE